jgi:hypothetical protein
MMLRWRIYYGDGSTYSSTDGSPFDAPRLNVQIIVGPDAQTGRYIVAQHDAYWWDNERERWFGGDRRGEWDYLCQLGPRVVLYGRFIGNAEYNACANAAQADVDFLPKCGWAQREHI